MVLDCFQLRVVMNRYHKYACTCFVVDHAIISLQHIFRISSLDHGVGVCLLSNYFFLIFFTPSNIGDYHVSVTGANKVGNPQYFF